jgi:hypothetical protein
MKRLALMAIALLVIGSSALAVTTCPTTTYDNYLVAGFSCVTDNLRFSSFSFSSSAQPAGIAVPASGIAVTPIDQLFNEGFSFNPGMGVVTQAGGINSFQDVVVDFTVEDINGAATIKDLGIFFNGAFTGTGSTDFAENYCLNANQVPGCPAGDAGQLHVTNPPPNFSDAVFFAPVSKVSVIKDVRASSGINGTASISVFQNTFSVIPEPASIAMFGTILVGVLGLVRRKYRKS